MYNKKLPGKIVGKILGQKKRKMIDLKSDNKIIKKSSGDGGIEWKKGNESILSLGKANDGYWVVYDDIGKGNLWGQGYAKRADALTWIKQTYNLEE